MITASIYTRTLNHTFSGVVIFVVAAFAFIGCSAPYTPQNGDIIFQTSRSRQSTAVQEATHSRYSHMGIVYLRNGVPFVFEAAGTVKLTPLREWIARGKSGRYVVKRLKDAASILTDVHLSALLSAGKQFEGKQYDLYFEWSDDRIYCSELVWKIYDRALGIKIGECVKLGDFDLSGDAVKKKMHERYGNTVPVNEPVISPQAMFASDLLVTVYPLP